MSLLDLLVTPFYMLIIGLVAFFVRPYVTNRYNRKYFLPALFTRFFGAIAIGLVYQFYYGGGDTFNYYHHGQVIWRAFLEEPAVAFKLIFLPDVVQPDTFRYTISMYWTGDPASYFVCRLVGFFGIPTLNAYSAIALIFATVSFTGLWALYQLACEILPGRERVLFYAMLLFPSVVFWGSGIMKDTIALTCTCWAFVAFYRLHERFSINMLIVLLLTSVCLMVVKLYILAALVPNLFLFSYLSAKGRIRNRVLRMIISPMLFAAFIAGGFFITSEVTSSSDKYSLSKIPETARVTAYDIAYWSGRDAGSTYTLGDLDGTWSSMLRLAPAAINVTLFRPYLWEVSNPLMLLSALESLVLFVITFYLFFKLRAKIWIVLSNPVITFCICFSLVFAFAVGISTFNFGTLVRYKIPMIPFYTFGLVMLFEMSSRRITRNATNRF